MKRPIIGISGSIIIHKGDNFNGYRRSYVSEDYVLAVIKGGGIPYILPLSKDKEVIREQVQMLDGLVLSGGHDVDPRFYNEEPRLKLGEVLPERDQFDLALLEYAKERQIPILGICRGFQLMNVYHGGSLYQDLSEYKDIKLKHDQVESPTVETHKIKIDKDSKIYQAFNQEEAFVNSFHHQILNKIGQDLNVVAKSSDGVAEAIEGTKYPFMLGVQFHPEMLHRENTSMSKIFELFIDSCYKK